MIFIVSEPVLDSFVDIIFLNLSMAPCIMLPVCFIKGILQVFEVLMSDHDDFCRIHGLKFAFMDPAAGGFV